MSDGVMILLCLGGIVAFLILLVFCHNQLNKI